MTPGVPYRTIRVLAADDSTAMRSLLKMLFQRHAEDAASGLPAMELCGSVGDGAACLEAVAQLKPDVLLLDFEMPGLDGLGVLKRLKTEASKLPVIMCSAYTERGARATLDALSLGAKDYVMKPGQQRDVAAALDLLAKELLPRIAALAAKDSGIGPVPRRDGWSVVARSTPTAPALCMTSTPARLQTQETFAATVCRLQTLQNAALPAQALHTGGRGRVAIVVIGVSTGGPSALETMLPMLPADLSVPVLIVQHMPKLFTGALAERLNGLCGLPVAEARDGEGIGAGGIWIAPGDEHMEVIHEVGLGSGTGSGGRVRLHRGQPLNGCRPSVDYLFGSAARTYGPGVLGIMMTGMGSDGFAGATEVQRAGGTVIAQDEASSAVWGMPGRVSRAGVAAETLPLRALASEIALRSAGNPASRGQASRQMGRRHGLL